MQVKNPMTMTEKILAKHSNNIKVVPGQNIWTNVDKLMTHDVCGPGTFGIFQREFGENAQVQIQCVNPHVSTQALFSSRELSIPKLRRSQQALLLLQVWDPEKIVIIPDHYIFTADARANRNVDILRCRPASCEAPIKGWSLAACKTVDPACRAAPSL